MGLLEYTELLLGMLLLGALCVLAFVWFRRRIIAGGKPLMLCAVRTPADPMWRLGLLRFGGRQLDWFTMIGPSLRPDQTWDRHELTLAAPTVTADVIPLLGESLTASATNGGRSFEIAMHSSGLTAMRAWMESQPPGLSDQPGGRFI